ncbi:MULTISPECIES: hypothetical protein [Streptomycetaceae]|uniref:hypothetical protein n=1 Tax=Streptomycetaceae TaxID=2062 RepID=UPI000938C344|nr:hypothetical protein [Streptomyces sp. CB02056]OKH97577.1 hypothetical protein AMK13_38460 [Streptomyces sp. CB02056]
MPPNFRRVTDCAETATHSTTRYSSHRARRAEYVVYACEWHSMSLTSSRYFGCRHNLRPLADDDQQQRGCGTMLDHRPADRVVADHFRLWLIAGEPVVDGQVQRWRDWAHRLRGNYEAHYLGHGDPEVAAHLDLALSVAERAQVGEHTPEQLAAVLDALAAAEHAFLQALKEV